MRTGAMVIALFASALVAFAQGKGKGHANKEEAPPRSASPVSVAVVFTETDRQIIREWVREVGPRGLPPGLAKRGELPPGLQKHLRKGGTLPPGLQKRISPFPEPLVKRLPPLPPGCGCERVFLEGRALIIVRATHAILDLINLF